MKLLNYIILLIIGWNYAHGSVNQPDSINLNAIKLILKEEAEVNFLLIDRLLKDCQESNGDCRDVRLLREQTKRVLDCLSRDGGCFDDAFTLIQSNTKISGVSHFFYLDLLTYLRKGEIPKIEIPELSAGILFPVDKNSILYGMGFLADLQPVKAQIRISANLRGKNKKQEDIFFKDNTFRIKELKENSGYGSHQFVDGLNSHVKALYELEIDGLSQILQLISTDIAKYDGNLKYKKLQEKDVQIMLHFRLKIVEIGYQGELYQNNQRRKQQNSKVNNAILEMPFWIANKPVKEWNGQNYCVGNCFFK